MKRCLLLFPVAATLAAGACRDRRPAPPPPPVPAVVSHPDAARTPRFAAELATVPAGAFTMGDDRGEPDERPAHAVYVSAFAIDRTEVTNAAYARCVKSGGCRPPAAYANEGAPAQPAVGVSWTDAEAYCRFAGERLPTEAEWEKAARGADGRTYPWGNAFDCARGNFGDWQGEGYCAAAGSAPGHTVAVGSFPSGASPYGALDLAGNAWEWVADWYAFDQYAREARAARPSAARDPTGPPAPDADGGRVVRGGGCCSYFVLPRASNRLRFPPDYRDSDIGFRCAKSLP